MSDQLNCDPYISRNSQCAEYLFRDVGRYFVILSLGLACFAQIPFLRYFKVAFGHIPAAIRRSELVQFPVSLLLIIHSAVVITEAVPFPVRGLLYQLCGMSALAAEIEMVGYVFENISAEFVKLVIKVPDFVTFISLKVFGQKVIRHMIQFLIIGAGLIPGFISISLHQQNPQVWVGSTAEKFHLLGFLVVAIVTGLIGIPIIMIGKYMIKKMNHSVEGNAQNSKEETGTKSNELLGQSTRRQEEKRSGTVSYQEVTIKVHTVQSTHTQKLTSTRHFIEILDICLQINVGTLFWHIYFYLVMNFAPVSQYGWRLPLIIWFVWLLPFLILFKYISFFGIVYALNNQVWREKLLQKYPALKSLMKQGITSQITQ